MFDDYAEAYEQAVAVRAELNVETKGEIWPTDYPDFIMLLNELNDWGRTAHPETARILGTNTSLLNRILELKKEIDIHTIRKVADRMVTHIRTEMLRLESAGAGRIDSEPKRPPPPPAEFTVTAVEWRVVPQTPDLQEKICQLVVLLEEVTRHATTANLPPEDRALTEIERAQLIAVLQTALKLLQSPLIEKGLLKKAGAMVKAGAKKAAEKQVELAFNAAASAAGVAIVELLRHL